MRQLLKFIRKKEGQSLVEYCLILLVVAVALVAALGNFGITLNGYYINNVANKIPQ